MLPIPLITHIDPESCVGQKPRSANEVLCTINELAASTSIPELGNYGVAALIINKQTKEIIAAGKNSVSHEVYHNGQHTIRGDDGHAEVNAMRAFYTKKKKALDEAKGDPLKAKKALEDFDPKNFEMWVNLQPCHMCCGALRACGMSAVYISDDPVVVAYAKQYKDVPKLQQEVLKLIRRIDDPERTATFPDETQLDPQLKGKAGQVFEASAATVRARKTRMTQERRPIVDISTAFALPHENGHSKDRAKKIIRAIKAASHNEDILSDFSATRIVEPMLRQNSDGSLPEQTVSKESGTDIPVAKDEISPRLMHYLLSSARKAESQGNRRNAAIAVDPFGIPWFCAHDKVSARNPLRTPIMRVIRRIEKARAGAGELAHEMPMPGQFTIVCLKEPTDMEAGRLASSSVKNILYLEPDLEHGVVSTHQIEKMTDFYRKQRGLEGAIRPVANREAILSESRWSGSVGGPKDNITQVG